MNKACTQKMGRLLGAQAPEHMQDTRHLRAGRTRARELNLVAQNTIDSMMSALAGARSGWRTPRWIEQLLDAIESHSIRRALEDLGTNDVLRIADEADERIPGAGSAYHHVWCECREALEQYEKAQATIDQIVQALVEHPQRVWEKRRVKQARKKIEASLNRHRELISLIENQILQIPV